MAVGLSSFADSFLEWVVFDFRSICEGGGLGCFASDGDEAERKGRNFESGYISHDCSSLPFPRRLTLSAYLPSK